jgi:hypothetical protein
MSTDLMLLQKKFKGRVHNKSLSSGHYQVLYLNGAMA